MSSHGNFVFGISLQTASSAILSDVSATRNGVHGLETRCAAAVTDTLTASNNGVFGINVNGSSITFSQATVFANSSALGVQMAAGGVRYAYVRRNGTRPRNQRHHLPALAR